MSTICVYGAARDDIAPVFMEETEKLGRLIGTHGHKLIYGAGATGLMGAVARGMTEVNGHIIGVTPHFMHKFEPVYECTWTIETKTMAKRKNVMESNADAFIVVPGGIGTFDEFFQILTLKELGQLKSKPIVLLNIDGYYSGLYNFMITAGEKGFLRDGVFEMFALCDTPEDALDVIERQLPKQAPKKPSRRKTKKSAEKAG